MTIRLPEIDFSIVPAYVKAENEEQRMLFVGQMTTGTATPGALYPSIDNANAQDTLFGLRSMLAGMIRNAKVVNKISRMDAIPLADFSIPTESFTQLFLSGTDFTFNSTYTEFVGSRLQQKDQTALNLGLAPYAGDIITCPNPHIGAVLNYLSFTAVDDGTIHYTIDGKYWTGTAWAASSHTYATSSTSADITAHIATLTPTGTNITMEVITDTGATQMWVSSVIITYDAVAAAVKASGTIAFSGTASAAGTYYVTVGSKINHRYEIDVTNLETATDIGAALVSAITLDAKCPVTAVNTSGSVAITAVNAGLEGNLLTLRVEGSATGITAAVTGMAGGATNPTLTNLFDVIGDARYQTIVYPSTYDLTPLTTLLAARWNVDNNILDGIGIITLTNTAANIETIANAKNTQDLIILANKTVNDALYKGSAKQEINNIESSIFAAVRALRLTQDASIAQYVTGTNGIKDNIGGPAIASLPYFNTPFATLPLIDFGKGFTTDEMTALKAAGACVLANNPSNNSIIAGEIITTYKTDPASNPDVSFKYCEYVDTASNIREYFYNNLRTRFAQSRLTGGDVQPNRNMANAAVIGAFMDGLYNDLGSEDYTLTQVGVDPLTGTDWRTFFKNNRTITLDLALGKVTITMIVPIVTQLRRIIVAMQIAFSANS